MNLEETIKAITALDNCLSNNTPIVGSSSSFGKILRELFDSVLKDNRADTNKYIMDTARCFMLNKTEIKVNLPSLCDCVDKDILSLIFFKMSKIDNWNEVDLDEFVFGDSSHTANLLTPKIYYIFPNITHIYIYTTDISGKECCPMSLIALLSIIKNTEVKKITIEAKKWSDKETWIGLLWNRSSSEYIEKYKAEKFNITVERDDEDKYDNIIICRM